MRPEGDSEGPKQWKGKPAVIGSEGPQMLASAKLATEVDRVKPERP